MHTPRPFGLAAYGGQLTADDLAFIDHIAKQLTNVKDTSKLQSLKWVYDLPDGGEVVIYDMGGVFRAIATKPSEQDEPPQHDYTAHSYIPMLFSGAITKSIVGYDEGVSLQITSNTQRRLTDYDSYKKAPSKLELMRFVVDYPPHIKEFEPNPPPRKKHTQYAKARPTWYSGSMAKVVQIVGGYGRQDLKVLPDTQWEQAQVRLPDKVKRAMDDTLKDKLLPAYTGYPPKDGQLQYDYKHRHTNAVAFDDQNKPWLLSISAKGVYAIPLPLIPATTTTAYREWIESVGDSEILSILDTFGGLPSGESFPKKSDEFNAWERAGVIIRICDTADFYTHLPYSTAMGWSFNTLGTDGYNTCYNYNQDGLIVGYTYNMTLKLASALDGGFVSDNQKTLDDQKAKELAVYLSKIFQKIDRTTAKGGAIAYKIRRLSDKELYERMDMSVDDWHNLTLEPIAKHTGQVRKVYEGLIWAMPNIKIPEPIFGGCMSIMPENWRNIPRPKKTDTPILAYFVGDDLRVVKLYIDDTKYDADIETNFEEVMTVGQWYKIETLGKSSMHGDIYLTLKDDRAIYAKSEKITEIEGKDVGYSKPSFNFDFYWHRTGTLYRERYYTHITKTKEKHGQKLSLGVTIPFFAETICFMQNHYTQQIRT